MHHGFRSLLPELFTPSHMLIWLGSILSAGELPSINIIDSRYIGCGDKLILDEKVSHIFHRFAAYFTVSGELIEFI